MKVPSLGSAAFRVLGLAWPGLLVGRRARWVLPLLAWPLLLPLLRRILGAEASSWPDVVLFQLDLLLPLAALFQASPLIRAEVENKTIVYLLARPTPRASVVLGRFFAYVAAAVAVVWPALLIGGWLTPGASDAGWPARGRELVASLGIISSYGALFLLAGLVLRKPLLAGLAVIFMGNVLVHGPGRLPWLTVTGHGRALVGIAAPSELNAATAAAVLAALTMLALAASVVVFESGEYVPEP
jgi:ABC-2 type transport system permease protein